MYQTIIIALLTFLLWNCNSDNVKQKNKDNNNITIDTTVYSLKSIDDIHERLTLKSYDQSLTDFIKSNPNKVDSIKKVIYLLPFGNMTPEVEKIIQSETKYLKAFLQLEVKVLDRIPYDSIKKISLIKTRLVPDSEFNYYSKMKGGTPTLREQIQADSFIKVFMQNNKPKDAIAVLGITEHDIYNPKYNYLFGTSEIEGRNWFSFNI